MIASLRGTIVELSAGQAVIDVQGVGYLLTVSAACAEDLAVGKEAQIVTYTQVADDALRLFGFADILEKRVFELLLLVSGIGPKTAADVVSRIDKRELLRAIGSGDIARIQAVKGIGKKSAERIVVELRDKVAAFGAGTDQPLAKGRLDKMVSVTPYGPQSEAITALEALGFTKREAEAAVAQAKRSPGAEVDVSTLVRTALQHV